MVSSRATQRRRQGRRLKREVYVLSVVLFLGIFQFSGLMSFPPFVDYTIPELKEFSQVARQVVLRDTQGNVVTRNSTSFSHFFGNEYSQLSPKDGYNTTLKDASEGRERILSILVDAGVVDLSPSDIMMLPTWKQVETLYGPEPVILGMEDSCQKFRENVPLEKRFLGVSGMFNSGTTAFGISLQANCRFPSHPQNLSNSVITDVNGVLNQVPWAKHKMATEKENHTIHHGIPKEHVLPIVLVRDPFYWMQSMCKQGYGARWDHNSDRHCPNLVPNDFDRRRFKRLQHTSSVQVWMGASPKVGPSWPSLVHYWNAWYQSYVLGEFPRVMIRFEDTLFHGRQLIEKVCECGGGLISSQHKYLVDEAKWNHKHSQNNMISAMIRYGSDHGRYKNMTVDDLIFASSHLDGHLLDLFSYKAY